VGERLSNLLIHRVKRKMRCPPSPVLAASPIALPVAMGDNCDELDLVPGKANSVNSSPITRLVVQLITSLITVLLV